ncbi:MAG TPA: YhcN/YlaJ family sporulation lipoprotein [Bacilli bacterium]|nr:YhcN/YlaJ family sporulation lipoprotein [Bacilli bacterium]
MRAAKWIALSLSVLFVTNTMTACSVLRTPFERQKIAENGGTAKKKNEAEASSVGGGGGDQEGSKQGGQAKTAAKKDPKQQMADREKAEGSKIPDKRASESLGQKKEREQGQGLFYVVPRMLDDTRDDAYYDEPQRDLAQENAELRKKLAEHKKANKPGTLATPDKVQDTEYQLAYNQPMTSAVSRLEGVDGGTVLLDANQNAYVAIDGQDALQKYVKAPFEADDRLRVKLEGKVPRPLQEDIASKLRSIDPTIGTVYITTNPEHVKSFHRYASQISRGEVNSLESKALADHIKDIWK